VVSEVGRRFHGGAPCCIAGADGAAAATAGQPLEGFAAWACRVQSTGLSGCKPRAGGKPVFAPPIASAMASYFGSGQFEAGADSRPARCGRGRGGLEHQAPRVHGPLLLPSFLGHVDCHGRCSGNRPRISEGPGYDSASRKGPQGSCSWSDPWPRWPLRRAVGHSPSGPDPFLAVGLAAARRIWPRPPSGGAFDI